MNCSLGLIIPAAAAAIIIMAVGVSVTVAGLIVAANLIFAHVLIFAAAGVVLNTGIITASAAACSGGILKIRAALVTGADRGCGWSR